MLAVYVVFISYLFILNLPCKYRFNGYAWVRGVVAANTPLDISAPRYANTMLIFFSGNMSIILRLATLQCIKPAAQDVPTSADVHGDN